MEPEALKPQSGEAQAWTVATVHRRSFILFLFSLFALCLPALMHAVRDLNNRLVWALDLAAHWQWLFACVAVLCCAIMARRHNLLWGLLVILPLLPIFSATAPLPADDARSTAELSVASINVGIHNDDAQPLAEWLSAASPDVVAVFEPSHAYAAGLERLSAYPHRVMAPAADPFGIALLSKHPLTGTKIVRDGDGIPHIDARVHLRGREVRIFAIHPMPPISVEYHRRRNAKLLELIGASAGPALIVGDFNATPWSTAFASVDAAGWRRATSLVPSWPTWGLGVFGIPIDHVLASPHFKNIHEERGPDIGSDHFPVFALLGLV
jgi:endonuclease/exonuclease/phosphatase (EEP) superfamily protein YafD